SCPRTRFVGSCCKIILKINCIRARKTEEESGNLMNRPLSRTTFNIIIIYPHCTYDGVPRENVIRVEKEI
ncbi:MAG: hypothetical protein QXV95_07295, partial [Sulfolobales archaeon]